MAEVAIGLQFDRAVAVCADDLLVSLRARFLDAQLKGDRRRALQVLVDQGLAGGVPVTDLLLRVITPAQREIGRLWEGNEISVADEHVATAISQLAMSHIYGQALPVPVRREHLVIACVDGDWHDMGARVAADVLEQHGFSVRLLGPSVPSSALLDRVRHENPDVVLLSITIPEHIPALRATLASLAARFPALPVLVGGRGAAAGTCANGFALPRITAPRAVVCAEIERLLDA